MRQAGMCSWRAQLKQTARWERALASRDGAERGPTPMGSKAKHVASCWCCLVSMLLEAQKPWGSNGSVPRRGWSLQYPAPLETSGHQFRRCRDNFLGGERVQ